MNNQSDVGRKLGGYLILLAIILLLIALRQFALPDGFLLAEGETAVFPTPPSANLAEETADLSAEVEAVEDSLFFTNLPVFNDSGLAPAPNPRTLQIKMPAHDFQTYTIERGDTPGIIANKFNIDPKTLLGGNPWLSQESNQLPVGRELVILPVDGVLHEVGVGETLTSIADQYQVTVEDIINYPTNNLEFPYRLQPEMELLIPGAEVGSFYWTAPKSAGGSSGPQQWTVIGTGTFVWPTTGRCITNFHWVGHPAIDVSLAEGTALVASDRGTVTYAAWAAGSYFDYGNLIVINHGNGYETLYAHLNSIGVQVGQTVEQGQWIGTSGNTGRSSGPHLHFEIRLNDWRDDPLYYLSGPVTDCT